jgi:hypothetical protein
MSDFVTALRAEYERLRAILQNTPEYRRMTAIEGLLADYTSEATNPEAVMSVRGTLKAPRAGTIAASVIDIAERYLDSKGTRAQSPEIAAAVQREGVMTDAPNVVSAVSSYLSTTKDRFDHVKGEGYGLVRWHQAPPNSSQSTDVGGGPKMEAATPVMEIAA